MLLEELRDLLKQVVGVDARTHADAQALADAERTLLDVRLKLLPCPRHARRLFAEAFALRRQLHAVQRAREDRIAKLLLEPPQLLRQRGLRQEQPLRRARHILTPRDLQRI